MCIHALQSCLFPAPDQAMSNWYSYCWYGIMHSILPLPVFTYSSIHYQHLATHLFTPPQIRLKPITVVTNHHSRHRLHRRSRLRLTRSLPATHLPALSPTSSYIQLLSPVALKHRHRRGIPLRAALAAVHDTTPGTEGRTRTCNIRLEHTPNDCYQVVQRDTKHPGYVRRT